MGFGSYTHTTVDGGGFSLTLSPNTLTTGLGILKPAGIRGEAAVALAWMDTIDTAIPVGSLRNQFGGEAYWKILLTPDLWITPGVQLIRDPTFNTSTDFVAVWQLKFRVFL